MLVDGANAGCCVLLLALGHATFESKAKLWLMRSWEWERALGMQLRPAVDHVLLVLMAFRWDYCLVAWDLRLFCSGRCWLRGVLSVLEADNYRIHKQGALCSCLGCSLVIRQVQ